MKFLNLDTGYSFDGLWENEQTKGYIFWFPNEQSINITYTMPICILTEESSPIELSMDNNEIFSFISHNFNTYVDGYEFHDPIYTYSIVTKPENIGKYYAHVFNVSCCGKEIGEYICKINIGDTGFIRVGADLYGENESVYINLSNMGVELPDTIQKAIYDSNVHEDNKDNILINRKFKELLSNYWDIVANKGSYKSLKNSLEWFEWGNALTIKEIWKHKEANKYIFDDRDLLSILENKIYDKFTNFIKTNYISLYCAMQNELDIYDSESNPELENIVLKWSKEDIQLKLSLLAQFFGIYFMPIHMSILHATIEDKVFTNTIKSIYGAEIKRDDLFGDFNYVECNIKDDDIFKITNVQAQATDSTVFGLNDTDDKFGVDIYPKSDFVIDVKKFATQYYTGPGVIIPIHLTIPNQNTGDFIKLTKVNYIENGCRKSFDFYNVFRTKHNKISIKFNFLARHSQQYELNFEFILASSKTITRKVNFTVEDADNLNINVYKIKSKDDSKGFTYTDFDDLKLYKYLFRIQNTNNLQNSSCYTQYLPYMPVYNENYSNYNGIKLSRTIVIDLQNTNGLYKPHTEHEILFIRSLMFYDYLEFAKYEYVMNENGDVIEKIPTYLIFVSKKFYANTPNEIFDNVFKYKYNIIRNDLGFYPQFHYGEKINGNNINDYTLTPFDAICCAAEINNEKNVEEFRYGHLINSAEWTFINSSNGEKVLHPSSSRKPFIANNIKSALQPGYYDISFKYSLSNGIVSECIANSAFRIKTM